MRVCMRVRMIVRTPRAARVEHTPTEHTTTEKDRNAGNTGKPEYICMIADNEKKYKKSLEKFGNMKKPPYLCSRNQTTNKFNNKITKQ